MVYAFFALTLLYFDVNPKLELKKDAIILFLVSWQIYEATTVYSLSFSLCLKAKVYYRRFYWFQDVHERFRTESHFRATGRFNERFLLSLASCKACVVMDDELNILPISSHIRSITPVPVKEVWLLYWLQKNFMYCFLLCNYYFFFNKNNKWRFGSMYPF
jgi:hypothetical protein